VAAAEKAISSPLLESGMEGAQAILLSITGGRDLSLVEVSEAAKVVQEVADPDADIIFGAMVDDDISDEVWVTVVATRFQGRPAAQLGVGRGTRVVREEEPERRIPAFRDSLDVPEFIPGG
jgi:cell division protein FtsZ